MTPADVRFGSLADICSAISYVCFAPNNDRKSEFPRKAMSALPPEADMCSANPYVRFVPIADIAQNKKIRLAAASPSKDDLRPINRAV